MTSITLSAPAKVNLFLKILSRRKDGYHNIITFFERISLADELTISKIPSGIIVSSDKFITRNPKDNLIYKAAESILECIRADKGLKGKDKGLKGKDKGLKGKDRGVEIRIRKRIPIAAGLGGGSSDAAATLIGINELYNLKLSDKRLAKLAGRLGADVPFFILDTPFAAGKGIGDRLTRIRSAIKLWHLIIYPGFKVATRDVYEAFDRLPKHLTTKPADDKISRYLADSKDLSSVQSMLRNNLEDVVTAKKPVIGRIIERLALFLDKKAIVSGSGPSVFCLYGTRKEAMAAKDKLVRSTPPAGRRGWQVFVAGTAV